MYSSIWYYILCKRKQKKLVIRLDPVRTFDGFLNIYKYYTKYIMFFNNKTQCETR